MKIVPGIYSVAVSSALCKATSADIVQVTRSRFPDGEMYVRIDDSLEGEEILLVSSTRRDEEIIDLLLLLDACRGRKCGNITLLIPYFGYARQHMRYRDGEAVSSYAIGQAAFSLADRAFVVEVHDLEAIGVFNGKVRNLKVETSIAKSIVNTPDFVVSPDDGGRERAGVLARALGCSSFSMEKKRIDSRTVEMEVPEQNISGKSVVIIDDIISTGGTVAKACSVLKEKGASKIDVVAIHGLFVNNSYGKIMEFADSITVTNTIDTPYSKIDISAEIYDQIIGGGK